MAEFLPLCDVLFNVISLAGYFCDVVFDVVMGYALLERGYKGSFAAAMSIVITSHVISQVLSLRWYLHVCWSGEADRKGRPPWLPILLHCLQLGVLWRYARLLVPVELRRVKHQVRDLCMLRLVHAFCEAAPMLLLQLHILFKDNDRETVNELGLTPEPSIDEPAANKAFGELNVISASLSLFSVCWALASFSKNVRLHNVHRLVLTWLGVIFQFAWRLGTVSARVCALTVYALVYEYWVFLVIGLHWVSMFLWLISPKNAFHGERMSRARKAYLSALVAALYVFAYVNLHERDHTIKMVTFYCVMCVENSLLVVAWWWSGRARRPGALAAATLGAFLAGLAFMLLYYRYFHVRRLGYMLGDARHGTGSTDASAQHRKQAHQTDNAAIPGVFNCRFTNPVNSGANGRKKKKPTSFVPPPGPPGPPGPSGPPAPAPAPTPARVAPTAAFWKRPLPAAHNHHGGSSENEGSSVGSRVNIQQKLQEKKQKQLAELRVIEEEIKQGKLAKTTPVAAEEIYSSLQRQPIPRSKTHAEPHAWPALDPTHSYQNYPVLPHSCHLYPTYAEIKHYNENNVELNDIKTRRTPRYNDSRTFYENPANVRNENRTPNYLLESRNYDNNSNPRNITSSPRNYTDVTSYESNPLDKTRIHNNGIYSDDHRQSIEDYSGYSENNNQSVYSKDDYVTALHSALTNVQSIDNGRSYECNQYGQNCERVFPYPGVGLVGKKMEHIRKMQRCRTPEILLAPHYLEGCNRQVCCHWGPAYSGRKKEESCVGGTEGSGAALAGGSSAEGSGNEARDTPRPPSDIDSQISLPRSYTLPREFRYWRRRPRMRDHAPSNNSSDGDVDSADDNESEHRSERSGLGGGYSPPNDAYDRRRRAHALRKQPHKPETKL